MKQQLVGLQKIKKFLTVPIQKHVESLIHFYFDLNRYNQLTSVQYGENNNNCQKKAKERYIRKGKQNQKWLNIEIKKKWLNKIFREKILDTNVGISQNYADSSLAHALRLYQVS